MKKAVCILFIFVILMSSCIVASAESNYEEYIYNTDGESVVIPILTISAFAPTFSQRLAISFA